MEISKVTILFVGNHFVSNHSNQNIWFELPKRLNLAGWGVLTTSTKEPKLLRLLNMLWIIFSKRAQYQVAEVDVFSDKAFIWAELAVSLLRSLKKPIVLTLHGGDLPIFAKANPKRVKRVLSAAQLVVSPSRYLQDKLNSYRDDITIIPNPVEVQSFPYRHRLSPEANLVWVRAFHEIYNPSIAPEIINDLKTDWPEIRLIMLGPDKGDGSFQRTIKMAESLGVLDKIDFPGGVSQQAVPGYLSKADIFINTTRHDNTPVSVIEAMACGLCIVSTNVGGVPWLLEDGVDALLVPPDDPIAMAKAVRRILTEPGLSVRLSANAREKAEQFSWSIVIPAWDNLFQDVLVGIHEQS